MSNANWLVWTASLFSLVAILARELLARRSLPSGVSKNHDVTLVVMFALAAMSVLILVAFLSPTPQTKGETPPTNWLIFLLMYLSMITGIIAQFFFFADDGSSLKWGLLLKPVLASPIIFIPLASAYQGMAATAMSFSASDLMIVLVAFQNGFFWKMIFDKQSASHKRIAK